MMQETIQVQMIEIDNLDIDIENLRGSMWEMDEDDERLVDSIGKRGILEPLLVRSAGPKDRASFTIMSGGRRFNAAIEAGLDVVPCIVREVDDITAAGISVVENRDRKDVPTWVIAFKVIEWFRRLDSGTVKSQRTEILATKFGCSPRTISDYIELDLLPAALQELVKDPSQWSETTRSLVGEILPGLVPSKRLSIEKAAMIARELYAEGKPLISEKRMLEVGVHSIWESRDMVREVLSHIRQYPKKPIADIFALLTERGEQTVSKTVGVRVRFTLSFVENIDRAAKKRQMDREHLVTYYVRDGLKRDGFL